MPEFKEVKKITEVFPEIDRGSHHKLIELQNSINSFIMDGKLILQTSEGGEILGYDAMYESIFVNNWIRQFAIGEVNGTRYFNFASWAELTDDNRKGVIVVEDKTNIPMFLIPPFGRPNMTTLEMSKMAYVVGKGSEMVHCLDEHAKDNISLRIGATIEKKFGDGRGYLDDRNNLTTYVPNWVYRRNGIVPMALKAMIYIRDVYKTVDDEEVFDKAEEILTRFYKGETISVDEKRFILGITNGEFNFNSLIKVNGETTNNSESKTEPELPLEENNSLFDD